MKKRSLLSEKIVLLYEDISEKWGIGKEIRVQTGREFELSKMKRLNKKYNVHMFSSTVPVVKLLQKNKRLESIKLLFKTKGLDKRLGKKSDQINLLKRQQTIQILPRLQNVA